MSYYGGPHLPGLAQNGLASTMDSNLKYKKKYGRLKKRIKALVFENGALCDEVSRVNESVALIKEERKALVRKLAEYEKGATNTNKPPSTASASHTSTSSSVTFPLRLGDLTVHSLGAIARPRYHAEEIYPIGYVATRVYGHARDPRARCVYACRIADGGDEQPRFEIAAVNSAGGGSAEESLPPPIVGSSPNYCHGILLQRIRDAAPTRNFTAYPKGGKFFGLTHPTVLQLIRNLPCAWQCRSQDKLSGGYETVKSEDHETEENDPTISYDKLQQCIVSSHHMISEIKEEPPDDILDFGTH